MQNHVIDPTYFYDAIEEFSFDYTIYVVSKSPTPDEYGKRRLTYDKQIIRGSLQSQGIHLNQSKTGNTQSKTCNFYCKSLYRISIGDIIEYKNNFYRTEFVQDYDEFGVRNATLQMIKLTEYRDFADYIKYLTGETIV